MFMKFLILTLTISFTISAKVSLIGGDIDFINKYSGVINIAIFSKVSRSTNIGFCTATKISDTKLITAAHCLYGKDIENIGWVNSPEFSLSRGDYFQGLYVESVKIHPSYRKYRLRGGANRLIGNDIAVITLEENEDKSWREFQNLKSYSLNFEYVEDNTDLLVYGYGCQVSFGIKDDVRRRKFGDILTISKESILNTDEVAINTEQLDLIFPSKFFSYGADESKDYISLCSGDSGGPVFNTNNEIVGINASGFFKKGITEDNPDRKFTHINLFNRVSTVESWILKNIAD